ncbi:hypothetical protein GCM10009808_06850 [Microbacterium sediminicola]|uniref:Uncharacterized protein n=1 Tax=Microbacterium sediminicola TaxID=415210 RepID=A0ABN2HSC5_9MICO
MSSVVGDEADPAGVFFARCWPEEQVTAMRLLVAWERSCRQAREDHERVVFWRAVASHLPDPTDYELRVILRHHGRQLREDVLLDNRARIARGATPYEDVDAEVEARAWRFIRLATGPVGVRRRA